MGLPVPANTVGGMLIDAWAPYITPDLSDYANAIGAMFEEVDELVEILGEDEGWSKLLDPTQCPAMALPYLAMYMGERLPAGLTEALQREWIMDHPNLQRGTLLSILLAAQRTLTGTRLVMYKERSGGGTNPEDYLQIRTYTSQTPNPTQVANDIYDVLPADIVLDYAAVTGQTYNQLSSTSATYTAMTASYASYNAVLQMVSGGNSWSRPVPIP